MKTIVFDIETYPFSGEFNKAKTPKEKLKHAPRMRVACALEVETGEYTFYEESEAEKLVSLLKSADRIVSFNGLNFDFAVLIKHYGLKPKDFKDIEQIDMHLIMSKKAGFKVSLDKAVQLNFNERKMVKGRAMTALDLEDLKEACKSDVTHTFRLWDALRNNTLKYPTDRYSIDLDDFGGPGSMMPDVCPNCHDVGCLVFCEGPEWGYDFDEMSEGEMAEYLAGTFGTVFCTTCETYFDYEV